MSKFTGGTIRWRKTFLVLRRPTVVEVVVLIARDVNDGGDGGDVSPQ